MEQKIVCQLDYDNYLVGTAVADESPLEPGVFLMPAGTVDVPLPKEFPQQRCKWTGTGWVYEDLLPPEPEQPEEDPLENCRQVAKAILAQTDWSQTVDVVKLIENAAEFEEYRAKVRALMFAPVASPSWPVEPQPKWMV